MRRPVDSRRGGSVLGWVWRILRWRMRDRLIPWAEKERRVRCISYIKIMMMRMCLWEMELMIDGLIRLRMTRLRWREGLSCTMCTNEDYLKHTPDWDVSFPRSSQRLRIPFA